MFESLALKYRRTLEMLDELTGRRVAVAAHRRRRDAKPAPVAVRSECHRPAGGCRTDRGYGSRQCLMQMLATGAIASLAEGRAIIRRSFDTEEFEPQDTDGWDEAYARLPINLHQFTTLFSDFTIKYRY